MYSLSGVSLFVCPSARAPPCLGKGSCGGLVLRLGWFCVVPFVLVSVGGVGGVVVVCSFVCDVGVSLAMLCSDCAIASAVCASSSILAMSSSIS